MTVTTVWQYCTMMMLLTAIVLDIPSTQPIQIAFAPELFAHTYAAVNTTQQDL